MAETAERNSAGARFDRLVEIMRALRAPGGCPWDRKQTHHTLRPYLVEETYEALDAIDRDDLEALAGELGDLLFQVVFHAAIAAEAGRFDVGDVIADVTAKLIRRHPHVFTATGRRLPTARRGAIRTPQRVIEQWERLKAREQAEAGVESRVLSGVPRALPALLRAHKIGARVAAVGFDWPNPGAVVDKIEEEVRELRAALAEGRARTADEMGDLLFSLANLSRHLGIEPEAALRRANDKFTRRFQTLERRLAVRGERVTEVSPAVLETEWAAVKRRRARPPSSTRGQRAIARAPGGRRSRR